MNKLKQFWIKHAVNPLDSLLKKAKVQGHKRILICWNRGLGDIPLGLYALTHRIRTFLPCAQITFITRSDLADGFKMLEGVHTLVDPTWKRGQPVNLEETLLHLGIRRTDFDQILANPDPTHWLSWQLGTLTPKLVWNPEWDVLCKHFDLVDRPYLGVHVQTETTYAYEKNWPVDYWNAFFDHIQVQYDIPILLFGFAANPCFTQKGIIDLRGKTTLFEMLSLIKNRCRYLLVPDSGVLSLTYYIDTAFAIDIVSLWADPKQGVLKQNVASPNPLLRHSALIGKNKDLRTVSVESALQALFQVGHA